MGVETRTIQRALKKLELSNIIKKEKIMMDGGYEQNVYNLDGLIKKLTPYALNDIGYRPRLQSIKREEVNEISF